MKYLTFLGLIAPLGLFAIANGHDHHETYSGPDFPDSCEPGAENSIYCSHDVSTKTEVTHHMGSYPFATTITATGIGCTLQCHGPWPGLTVTLSGSPVPTSTATGTGSSEIKASVVPTVSTNAETTNPGAPADPTTETSWTKVMVTKSNTIATSTVTASLYTTSSTNTITANNTTMHTPTHTTVPVTTTAPPFEARATAVRLVTGVSAALVGALAVFLQL